MSRERKLLLDTCAVVWLGKGVSLSDEVLDAMAFAAFADGVFVSPVSAWEIGLLSRPRPHRDALIFLPDPKAWLAELMVSRAVRETPFTFSAAISASELPGELHNDPADRLLIATAREIGAAIVTRDRKMIDYAAAGHLRVVAC